MRTAPHVEHATAADCNPSAVACDETLTPPPARGKDERHAHDTLLAHPIVNLPQQKVDPNSPPVQEALARISLAVQRALMALGAHEAKATISREGGAL